MVGIVLSGRTGQINKIRSNSQGEGACEDDAGGEQVGKIIILLVVSL
jgi:hypothetical protein